MFWTVTLSLLAGMGQLLKLFFLTLLFNYAERKLSYFR